MIYLVETTSLMQKCPAVDINFIFSFTVRLNTFKLQCMQHPFILISQDSTWCT